MNQENLVNPKEMASVLGVPVSWVYQKTRLGEDAIPFFKVGKYLRFNPEEVKEFFKKREQQVQD